LPAKAETILILGGTTEAATLAARLTDGGHNVTTSLAGRTREPAPLKGKTRTGGLGGAQGLAAYVRDNAVTLLVDMTHPFATQISANARKAAELTGVKLIAWHRPAWEKVDGDKWLEVPDVATAVATIPPSARVLLALGSQHIAPFAARPDVHFLIRMIDPPPARLALPNHELLLAKPGSVEEEYALLRDHHLTHIVCRNSGGKASYAKIAAARLLALPVIVIARVSIEPGTASLEAIEQQIVKAIA
jgi:precorrin-6A/cobalt-precorrin-6A reductase